MSEETNLRILIRLSDRIAWKIVNLCGRFSMFPGTLVRLNPNLIQKKQ